MLWQVLIQFLFRLAAGLAMAMTLTSPRLVSAGFYRVHLWVVLGLNTFTVAVVALLPDFPNRVPVMATAVAGAVVSYVGSVIWLYEKPGPGRISLTVVTVVNLAGAFVAAAGESSFDRSQAMLAIDVFSSALLLGSTFAAMLLGHWYLNTPTMKMTPLKRLILLMALAVCLRAVVCVPGLLGIPPESDSGRSSYLAFLALRWLAGLIGVLALTAMTWQSLKIPNTQSATGILYVAVMFVFLGELTEQLLSAGPSHPV